MGGNSADKLRHLRSLAYSAELVNVISDLKL